MPYSLCDMDCDQDINKSELEEHCSDCLCIGGLEDLDQQDVPATKAWRPTSVVEERIRPKTLSISKGLDYVNYFYNMFEIYARIKTPKRPWRIHP